jgi:hypothetical protein
MPTEETKQKIRATLLGRKRPIDVRKKISESLRRLHNSGYKSPLIGSKFSEERKKAMSERQKGFRHSEATKEKLRQLSLGVKFGKEFREKCRLNNLGKKHSDETKLKISRHFKGRYTGELASNWRGGLNFIKYPRGWSAELKRTVRLRDGFKCMLCGISEDKTKKKLSVHHINYNKKDLNINNLISLCNRCHGRTHYNRPYWLGFLQSFIGKERMYG